MSNDQLPPTPSNNPSPGDLPAMNESAAAKTDGSSQGVKSCEKKTWFAVSIIKINEKNKKVYIGGINIDLKLSELGATPKQTVKDEKRVKIKGLTPGGTGDVLNMTHDENVYEALGDFS